MASGQPICKGSAVSKLQQDVWHKRVESWTKEIGRFLGTSDGNFPLLDKYRKSNFSDKHDTKTGNHTMKQEIVVCKLLETVNPYVLCNIR